MNVITIPCDTLRRDHCGPYHHNRSLAAVTGDGQPDWVVPTPTLNRLAARHGLRPCLVRFACQWSFGDWLMVTSRYGMAQAIGPCAMC